MYPLFGGQGYLVTTQPGDEFDGAQIASGFEPPRYSTPFPRVSDEGFGGDNHYMEYRSNRRPSVGQDWPRMSGLFTGNHGHGTQTDTGDVEESRNRVHWAEAPIDRSVVCGVVLYRTLPGLLCLFVVLVDSQ